VLDGITLSGGDPFFQAKEFFPLVKKAHELGLNV
jgi:pyruvate-formate lyase-activating enzyme